METFSDLLIQNKEWLFSGGGIALLAWIGRILFTKRNASSEQTISSGDNSKNIQAGRDVNIRTTKKNVE